MFDEKKPVKYTILHLVCVCMCRQCVWDRQVRGDKAAGFVL